MTRVQDKLRRRAGVACFKEGLVLAVEMQDPVTGQRFWSLPGGEIEAGETAEQAAARETMEETGYAITLGAKVFTSQYLFHWAGASVACETQWFTAVCTATPPRPVNDASYLLQASWLPWPASRSCFSYHPSIAEAVERLAALARLDAGHQV